MPARSLARVRRPALARPPPRQLACPPAGALAACPPLARWLLLARLLRAARPESAGVLRKKKVQPGFPTPSFPGHAREGARVPVDAQLLPASLPACSPWARSPAPGRRACVWDQPSRWPAALHALPASPLFGLGPVARPTLVACAGLVSPAGAVGEPRRWGDPGAGHRRAGCSPKRSLPGTPQAIPPGPGCKMLCF